MKKLNSLKGLFSAATLVAFGSSIAMAQAKPVSTKRIPISKEAPGEVVTPKTDTVTVYRTDTLRLSVTTPPRVDTVRTTNTVVVHDTTVVQPMVKPMHLPGGLYFGVGGGVMAPNGSIYNPNNSGPAVQAQLGWQGANNPLGFRIDGNWNKPGQDAAYAAYQIADPTIVNISGDAKLNLPFFTHLMGLTPRFNLYGIGGGSYVAYKNLPIRITAAGGVPPANVQPGTNSWQNHLGWNAGGGMSLAFGRTELFVETRVIAWTTDASPQARQMPFILGVNLY